MIAFIRNSRASKILWLFTGLYLLNGSVDNPDVSSSFETANRNFNDVENLIEVVVEHLLGFENAIAEHDDSEHDDEGDKNAKAKVQFFQCSEFQVIRESVFFALRERTTPVYIDAVYVAYKDIDSPPPNYESVLFG